MGTYDKMKVFSIVAVVLMAISSSTAWRLAPWGQPYLVGYPQLGGARPAAGGMAGPGGVMNNPVGGGCQVNVNRGSDYGFGLPDYPGVEYGQDYSGCSNNIAFN